MLFWESCGCDAGIAVDQAEHSRAQIVYGIETDEFEEQVLSLEYELLQCETVREMSRWIPKCIPAMRCDAMYLIMDEHMNDFRELSDYYDRHLIEDEEFCVHGYPEKMQMEFAYEDGVVKESEETVVEGIFPTFDYAEGGKDFLFLPLHFREHTVGYFVIRNAVYLMEKQYLFQIINVLTSAMENLHKKERLAYLNQVLSELYVKDAMTGMYNRLGYQKLACRMFEKKKQTGENLSIIFMDMDRLKSINDEFGHIYGDWAIKTIASAILKYIPEGAVAVRSGGDEFLVVLEQTADAEIGKIIGEIRKDIPGTFGGDETAISADGQCGMCPHRYDDWVRSGRLRARGGCHHVRGEDREKSEPHLSRMKRLPTGQGKRIRKSEGDTGR